LLLPGRERTRAEWEAQYIAAASGSGLFVFGLPK
jgi:hypothetical protein